MFTFLRQLTGLRRILAVVRTLNTPWHGNSEDAQNGMELLGFVTTLSKQWWIRLDEPYEGLCGVLLLWRRFLFVYFPKQDLLKIRKHVKRW